MAVQDIPSTDKPKRTWPDIARELDQEKDPHRIEVLAKELNDAMLAEEREKAQQRLGRTSGLT